MTHPIRLYPRTWRASCIYLVRICLYVLFRGNYVVLNLAPNYVAFSLWTAKAVGVDLRRPCSDTLKSVERLTSEHASY